MIVFNNWKISCTGVIAQQYDNLTRKIEVIGKLPEGYEWSLLVECNGNKDTLRMELTGNGAEVILSQDNLSLSGYYKLQLRGNLAEDTSKTRHTNVAQTFVPASLTGTGEWPEIPSEFAQIEQRIMVLNARAKSSEQGAKDAEASAKSYSEQAQAVAGEIPYIGTNGNWFIGNQDTGVMAKGRSIYYGENVLGGDIGREYAARPDTFGTDELLVGDMLVSTIDHKGTFLYRITAISGVGPIAVCLSSMDSPAIYYYAGNVPDVPDGSLPGLNFDSLQLGNRKLKEGDLVISACGHLVRVDKIISTKQWIGEVLCSLKGDPGNVLTAPNGTRYQLAVDNNGNLTTTEVID